MYTEDVLTRENGLGRKWSHAISRETHAPRDSPRGRIVQTGSIRITHQNDRRIGPDGRTDG